MRERATTWLNSLTAKYVAIFTLLVAVPAIGISWYLLDSSYSDNKQALIRLHKQKAQSLANALTRTLENHASRLGSLHAEGVPLDVLADDVLLPFRVDDPNIGSIVYVDAKGRTRASTPDNEESPNGLEEARFFKQAKANGVYYGELELGNLDYNAQAGTFYQECVCEIQIATDDNYGGGGVFLETY